MPTHPVTSICCGAWRAFFPQGSILSTKSLFNGALLRPFMVIWTMKNSRARRPVCKKAAKGPIIIMGHSLGADAAIFMANKMKSLGAPVALVVTFGPTMNLVVPSNVSQVINYYTGNTLVTKGPGFRGTISNVDLNGAADINHLNVEKSGRLHTSVISKFRQSLAADVPHQSRDKGEQARPPPNNEHAFHFHLRTKLAHGRIRSIHAFDRSRIGRPGTQPSRERHYRGRDPDVYQARVDREITAINFM